MGRIDPVISDDLEKRLRMKAVEKFGGKKGSLTIAVEDAITLWLAQGDSAPSEANTNETKHKKK